MRNSLGGLDLQAFLDFLGQLGLQFIRNLRDLCGISGDILACNRGADQLSESLSVQILPDIRRKNLLKLCLNLSLEGQNRISLCLVGTDECTLPKDGDFLLRSVFILLCFSLKFKFIFCL